MAHTKTKTKQRPKGTSSIPSGTTPTKRSIAWEWTKSILLAVGLALLIRWPVAEPFKIPSGSMEPTLLAGDRIFVDKHIYGVRWPFNGFRIPFTRTTVWYARSELFDGRHPERWDIVVFKSVEHRQEHDTLVKRVVGLGGEHVLIRGGTLYIDGKPVETPDTVPDVYYSSPPIDPRYGGYGIIDDEAHTQIPEGHVFLLGDNSSHSRDGRWFGWVPEHHILGRVTSIWFPPSRWRDFTGFTDTLWWNGLLFTIAAIIFIRLFVGRSWRVFEESIGSASIHQGDHLFVRFSQGIPIPFTQRRLTRGHLPARGDLVLYRPPDTAKGSPSGLLGYVVGLPGERVFIDNRTVKIDDEKMTIGADSQALDFTKDGVVGKFGRSRSREYSLVPGEHVFVLTDAAPELPDSREFGWIPRENIVGTAKTVWWPIRRWRRVGVPTRKT